MKKIIYITSLVFLAFMVSCSPASRLERAEADALKGEVILHSIDNQHFVFKADKMHLRRGRQIFLRESNNYILIEKNMARVNLAYLGRSHDLRGISGINMLGHITEKNVSPKKRGNTLVSYIVEHKSDRFEINILVSKSGRCTVDLYNPKIDPMTYTGYFTALK